MRISTLIKIVAAFIVLTVLACTLIVVNHYFGEGVDTKNTSVRKITDLAPQRDEPELVQIEDLKKRISSKNNPEIILGAPALRKAKKVLSEAKFDDAKLLLEQIVVDYEDAPAAVEAYRILGEMNMDELFEIRDNDERFIKYTVKRGDTYLGIVQDHNTNFDLTMLINDMTSKNTSGLQPKQVLLLMPLNFSLRIIPHKNQLFLIDSKGDVVKMYEPVIDMTIPKNDGKFETVVNGTAAYYNGSRVNATRGNYRESDKVIKIQNPRIEIMGETTSIPNSFKGIVLSKPDMEELVLLLRGGNKVEILY